MEPDYNAIAEQLRQGAEANPIHSGEEPFRKGARLSIQAGAVEYAVALAKMTDVQRQINIYTLLICCESLPDESFCQRITQAVSSVPWRLLPLQRCGIFARLYIYARTQNRTLSDPAEPNDDDSCNTVQE